MSAEPGRNSQNEAEPEPTVLQVTGDLDLHTFRPRDLPDLLPAWFEECRAQGILTVRVIHGKGTGTLRNGVHRLLEKMSVAVSSPPPKAGSASSADTGALPLVRNWSFPAPESAGGWGATLVYLR